MSVIGQETARGAARQAGVARWTAELLVAAPSNIVVRPRAHQHHTALQRGDDVFPWLIRCEEETVGCMRRVGVD